ncbi:LysR family transcriptional regulator [Brucella intermedia]|uniref:LysR family transcriptional regulator n=1 Tax=Brucella intermedia TaxID=94625 RepID=UPI00209B5A15|nr:LysR family transcriptional regulator [Brucella intermedia]MCO7729095.1 LysR family transcriptional regulator [Brucella intermedia]
MSEMDDLRSFVEVMRGGGYSRAARQLGLSKSIISRRIARLEAGLGTRLLDRTTRGMSPTDAGSELWVRAERILADYEEARDVVAKRGGGIVGPLRLAAPLAFGLRHIAPIVTDMAALHPGLELDVSYSDKFVNLIEERFDAAIRIGNLRDSSLVARRLAPARSVIVASPDYLDRKGRPKVPRDLSEHECLEYFGRMASEWRFRDGERWLTVRVKGRLRSDNGDAILHWAVAGLGVANLPGFLVADAIEAGRLEVLLPSFPGPEYAIHVLRPPGAYVPGKVRLLIDFLVERLGRPPS